jgi:hypothetical protein
MVCINRICYQSSINLKLGIETPQVPGELIFKREYLQLSNLNGGFLLIGLHGFAKLILNSTEQELEGGPLFLYGTLIAHIPRSVPVAHHNVAQGHVEAHVVQVGVDLLELVSVRLLLVVGFGGTLPKNHAL